MKSFKQFKKIIPVEETWLFGSDMYNCRIGLLSFTRQYMQGRIQDFVLGGTNVGEGSGDRLRSPVGSCPGRGPLSPPRKLLGFEYLRSFSVNNFEAFCECDEVY